MPAIDQHIFIDKYLLGELSPSEVAAFEETIRNNATLAQEVELQKLIVNGIISKETKKQKENFKELDNQLTLPNFRFMNAKKYITASFAIAAVLAIVVFMVYNPDDKLNNKLFAENFEVLPTNQEYLTLSRGDESPSVGISPEKYAYAVQAMRAYDQKKYKGALPLFEQALQHKEKAPELLLYMSICQLQQNQIKPAIKNLEWLANQKAFQLNQTARWYLALAYLHNGNIPKSKEIFKAMSISNHNKADEAKIILEQLEK